MIPFSFVIKQSRPPEMLQSELNRIVRESLIEAATYWLVYYRPLHFLPSAVQRYSYSARSPRYLAMKRKRDMVKIGRSLVQIAKPTAPLVLTGRMRDAVLNKAPADFRIIARATSAKQTVTIKVPIPHPLNPKHAGEIGRMVRGEIEQMHNHAAAIFRDKIANLNQPSTKRIP